jgi:hypothetical protein
LLNGSHQTALIGENCAEVTRDERSSTRDEDPEGSGQRVREQPRSTDNWTRFRKLNRKPSNWPLKSRYRAHGGVLVEKGSWKARHTIAVWMVPGGSPPCVSNRAR